MILRRFHGAVGFVERLIALVEAVCVLHDEFAGAHHSVTGPDFVAKLDENLIHALRQAPIALHVVARHHRDDFLVGRSERERALPAVLELEELRSEAAQPSRLLVYLDRMEHRHEHLLTADRIHLLPHDRLDFLDDLESKWQKRIDARCELADEPRAQHEAVARDLGLRGILLERRNAAS
jgi:hypothetical protein